MVVSENGRGREQLLDLDIITPILEKEAEIKRLKVFLFRDEELKKYYANANPDVGVILLARDESSAKFNIQNLRRCYLVNLTKNSDNN
jgi:hypothetical protein